MLGVLTNSGKVNYVSLDDFLSIDKMNYFETYFEKQFQKFCNELPRIVERNEWAYHQYEKNRSNDFIFNKSPIGNLSKFSFIKIQVLFFRVLEHVFL